MISSSTSTCCGVDNDYNFNGEFMGEFDGDNVDCDVDWGIECDACGVDILGSARINLAGAMVNLIILLIVSSDSLSQGCSSPVILSLLYRLAHSLSSPCLLWTPRLYPRPCPCPPRPCPP